MSKDTRPEWMKDPGEKEDPEANRRPEQKNRTPAAWHDVERTAGRLSDNSLPIEDTDGMKLVSVASGGWAIQDKTGGIHQAADSSPELINKVRKTLGLEVEQEASFDDNPLIPNYGSTSKPKERKKPDNRFDDNPLIPD